MRRSIILLAVLPILFSCSNMEYDVSGGIDNEITLFSDQVSVPLGDIGPITPKSLLDGAGLSEFLADIVKEDEDGYLIVEQDVALYSNLTMLMGYMVPDQSSPADFSIGECTGDFGDDAGLMEMLGFKLSPQIFTLRASNPLTQDISVSGKLTISSMDDGEEPSEVLHTQEFSKLGIAGGAEGAEFLRVESEDVKRMYEYKLENLFFHLPASFSMLDPTEGMGVFSLDGHYKSYVCLRDNLDDLPINIDDLNIPLEQFRVQQARIRADVYSEIPLGLEIESIQALVDKTNEKGRTYQEVCESVSISAGQKVAPGSFGKPAISPLEIVISADEGIIPDLSGLSLEVSIKAPSGVEDKRISLNQTIKFNNIRATVSGGITIQSL